MKIAQFTPTFLPNIGGIEIVVHNLALQQQANGHEVTIVTNYQGWKSSKQRFPYEIRPLWPRAIKMGMKSSFWRWSVAKVLQIYQLQSRYDIWHIHSAYAGAFLAQRMLRAKMAPALITCHGADIQTLSDINYGYRLRPDVGDAKVIESLMSGDKVVAISQSMYRLLVKLGVPPRKIVAVPNGVHVNMIAAHTHTRKEIRRRLGWPEDLFVILTVGRNHRKKGYKFIPEIIRCLQPKIGGFRWLVVGGGTETLQQQAKLANLTSHLQVKAAIGQRKDGRADYKFPTPDLIDLYKAADVFVLPSLIESFGVVLIEAMAAGLPVVTTEVPGCRDVVEDGQTGLLAPPADPEALAKQIVRLYQDGSLYTAIQQQARRDVMQYDWPIVSQQYEEVYQQLIYGT